MSIAAQVGVVASATIAVLTLLGLATRFVLVPYLRDQLVKPVAEAIDRLTGSVTSVQAVANAAAQSSSQAHRRLDHYFAATGRRSDHREEEES